MYSELETIDVAIVGAGIIGLNLARELSRASKLLEIAVFEESPYLGDQTSGRNSGVLHAGLYYEHGGLKHTHCMRGRDQWVDIASELDIPFQLCGKFVVCPTRHDEEALEKLYQKALTNGVAIEPVSTKKLVSEIGHICQVHSGLFSKKSGIIDAASAVNKIADYVESKDIPILRSAELTYVEQSKNGHILKCGEDYFKARTLVNVAGTKAVTFRTVMGLTDYQDVFVPGRYLRYAKSLNLPSLIYPVPPKDLQGLGVHITFDMQGDLKFGPDVGPRTTELDYHLPQGLVDQMYPAISQLFKNVEKNDLSPSMCGVRPKIKKSNEEGIFKDFVIQAPTLNGVSRYVEALGIESPGLTAAPSIALELADLTINQL